LKEHIPIFPERRFTGWGASPNTLRVPSSDLGKKTINSKKKKNDLGGEKNECGGFAPLRSVDEKKWWRSIK